MSLTNEEIEKLKTTLLIKREEILRELGINNKDLIDETHSEDHNHPHHFADLASISEEQQNTMAIISHESKILDEINDALIRIEKGKYGKCECGGEIPAGRLKVLPEAKLCIKCQATKEKYGDL